MSILTCYSCSNSDNLKQKNETDTVMNSCDLSAGAIFLDKYVICGDDTIPYPQDLALNQEYVFSALKSDTNYQLKVKRTSNTAVYYALNYRIADLVAIERSGNAKLPDDFFYTSKRDTKRKDSADYASYWYFNEDKGCHVGIRIGIEPNKKNNINASVNFICDDKNKHLLNIDNCPTLKLQKERQ